MDIEEEEHQLEHDNFSSFLRRQILPPLSSMLMSESRTNTDEEVYKAKLLVSVATVKVLLRLSFDTFLR